LLFKDDGDAHQTSASVAQRPQSDVFYEAVDGSTSADEDTADYEETPEYTLPPPPQGPDYNHLSVATGEFLC
jgi:hypothetical protein